MKSPLGSDFCSWRSYVGFGQVFSGVADTQGSIPLSASAAYSSSSYRYHVSFGCAEVHRICRFPILRSNSAQWHVFIILTPQSLAILVDLLLGHSYSQGLNSTGQESQQFPSEDGPIHNSRFGAQSANIFLIPFNMPCYFE